MQTPSPESWTRTRFKGDKARKMGLSSSIRESACVALSVYKFPAFPFPFPYLFSSLPTPWSYVQFPLVANPSYYILKPYPDDMEPGSITVDQAMGNPQKYFGTVSNPGESLRKELTAIWQDIPNSQSSWRLHPTSPCFVDSTNWVSGIFYVYRMR